MTLRMKALIAVVLAMAASAALIYGVSHRILVHELLSIESDQMAKDVSVLERTIERELAELDTRVFDYAAWDDSYEFVEDPSQEYIETNLPDNLYTSFAINLLAFVRPDGAVIHGRLFDLENGASGDLTAGLESLWAADSPVLVSASAGSPLNGVVNTDDGTFLLASRPILRSDEEGPPRGALVMGRLVNASLVEYIAEQTQLKITIEALGSRELSPDVQASLADLSGPGSVTITPLDSETIAGYTRFDDIYGKPALVLKVESPRSTYQEGTGAVTQYVLIVLGIILAIGIALDLALGRWILVPLHKMVDQVRALAAEQKHAGRLEVTKGVEFGTLGREINHLLDELEETQEEVSHLYGVAREQADRDSLTGLLSRRAVFDKLEKILSVARARSGKFALMMIDVDGFKAFNDTHGHLAGDVVLEELGKVLAECTREGDLAGRYGGDEFLIVLPNTDAYGAAAQAQRLLCAADDLESYAEVGAKERVSLSIGISTFPDDGSEFNELIASADANLYVAKQVGGHTVSCPGLSSMGDNGAFAHVPGMGEKPQAAEGDAVTRVGCTPKEGVA